MELTNPTYDALLVVSFGGPEGPDDVIPFLENVLRGKNVPRERMLEVAEHYQRFGGASPINQQNRDLIVALERELRSHAIKLPIHWGNRNWRPLLHDTLREMADNGVRRALAFVTSAFSSYSGCRQYLEDIERARRDVGPAAPRVDKLRACFNHPGFIETMADSVRAALEEVAPERRARATLLFSAHSIPVSMAAGCAYVQQLEEARRLVSEAVGVAPPGALVYQSRSGPPGQPWLEPDICDTLRQEHEAGLLGPDVVLLPIGFLSDHIEVLFDLDTEARTVCEELGVRFHRAATAGCHPRFVSTIRELIEERLGCAPERAVCGVLPPCPDVCPADCCPAPVRRGPVRSAPASG